MEGNLSRGSLGHDMHVKSCTSDDLLHNILFRYCSFRRLVIPEFSQFVGNDRSWPLRSITCRPKVWFQIPDSIEQYMQ